MSKMASSLNENNLEKKLSTVTNTQESIQTLSLWCIHHRAHHKKIVDVWMRVMKKSKPSHRLALYYLANDVIQNSKRKNNSSFADSWAAVLKDTIPLCRDDKIKSQVERIFTIWEQRNIYDVDFIDNLKSLFSSSKGKSTMVDTKVLTEFKPQKLIEKIKKVKKAESESELKQKQLRSMKIDVSSSETLRQLKDRANGDKFSKEFEDATAKLAEYVDTLEKELQERKAIMEIMEKAEKYYSTQRGEAKIVANAYKNFGSRVKNLKKKLTEQKNNLPSPLPTPSHDAPSPIDSSDAGSPKPDASKDNTEAVDMEMSDEETSGTLRLEDPGSPGSAPSPDGSPIGLNIPSPPPPTKRDVGKKDESRKHIQNKKSHSSQGPNAMTSLMDSMSGSMSMTSRKGSLESRLSNLMQNMSNFSPTIDGGLFDEPNSTPPTVPLLSVTPMVTMASNDGGGTPLKDESSGTGSATPLQDEDREASYYNNIKLLRRIESKEEGNNVSSPMNKTMQFKRARDSWNRNQENHLQQQTMEFQSKQNDEKLSISEFLNKIGGAKPSWIPQSRTKKQPPPLPVQQQHPTSWFPNSSPQFGSHVTTPEVPPQPVLTNQYNYGSNFEPEVNPYNASSGYANTDYFPVDEPTNATVGNNEAMLSPTLCRPMKRNPNIVELTPSPTRGGAVFGGSGGGGVEDSRIHSNLITVVQNSNVTDVTSYQNQNKSNVPIAGGGGSGGTDRIRFSLKVKQGPTLSPNIPTIPGFSNNNNSNLRLVSPNTSTVELAASSDVDAMNGKQIEDVVNNDTNETDGIGNDEPSSTGMTSGGEEEISRIETVGGNHRGYDNDLLYGQRRVGGDYDNYSLTSPAAIPSGPAPLSGGGVGTSGAGGSGFNWQENWDTRNSFENSSFFPQQRFSFNPTLPKRFPHHHHHPHHHHPQHHHHPRFDGRRPPYPPRF